MILSLSLFLCLLSCLGVLFDNIMWSLRQKTAAVSEAKLASLDACGYWALDCTAGLGVAF